MELEMALAPEFMISSQKPPVQSPFTGICKNPSLTGDLHLLVDTMVNMNWNHFGHIPPIEQNAKASAERLYLDLKEAFPVFVADFEHKFTAWQRKWFDSNETASFR
jgi:hypothetical protein